MTMTPQFADMTSSGNFFDVVLFLLSGLVTGPTFISISSLVLELWLFFFVRDWPEIWKWEIPLFKFCLTSGDWGSRNTKFGTDVSNEMLLFAAKCQGYSFCRFWVIKGNPTVMGGGGKITTTTQIRVKRWLVGKEGSDLFEEVGCNFYTKNKLKSKKFNDKKVDKQK